MKKQMAEWVFQASAATLWDALRSVAESPSMFQTRQFSTENMRRASCADGYGQEKKIEEYQDGTRRIISHVFHTNDTGTVRGSR